MFLRLATEEILEQPIKMRKNLRSIIYEKNIYGAGEQCDQIWRFFGLWATF